MNLYVTVAIQVLPKGEGKSSYALVDEAIAMIADSGLMYQVCPFETVIEGNYDDIMKLLKEVQLACYNAGADELMTYVKIQSRRDEIVTIEDKMEKYH